MKRRDFVKSLWGLSLSLSAPVGISWAFSEEMPTLRLLFEENGMVEEGGRWQNMWQKFRRAPARIEEWRDRFNAFRDEIRAQYETTRSTKCALELLAERGIVSGERFSSFKKFGWKLVVGDVRTGQMENCAQDIRYLPLAVWHDQGTGYQKAASFKVGIVEDGQGNKDWVVSSKEKRECFSVGYGNDISEAETSFRKIIKWILLIAAVIIGVKIALWLLPIIVMLAAAALVLVVIRALLGEGQTSV